MLTQIRNARILTPFSQMEGVVVVDDGCIVGVVGNADIDKNVKVVDARGMYLVPGYVDIHAHGSAAAHVMDGTVAAITTLCNEHAACGTTTIVPTTEGAPLEKVICAVENIRTAGKKKCGATIAGAHVQGLFCRMENEEGEGCADLFPIQERQWQALLKRADSIRMVGVAPEMPGAMKLGDALKERGVIPSVAGSDADYEQILMAVSHGFGDISELYRKSAPERRRNGFSKPGVLESGLVVDELTVQVPADGWQIPLVSLQIIYRCKSAEGIILVSDAGGAHTSTGKFEQGFSTMALLVRNMVAAGVSLRVALRMATVNPARRIGLDRIKGRVAPGYDADLLLLDSGLNVRFTMAKGRILRNDMDTPGSVPV